MKITTNLAERGNEFDLFLNGSSIYDYNRYVEQTDDESAKVDGKIMRKIQADLFNLNGAVILEKLINQSTASKTRLKDWSSRRLPRWTYKT